MNNKQNAAPWCINVIHTHPFYKKLTMKHDFRTLFLLPTALSLFFAPRIVHAVCPPGEQRDANFECTPCPVNTYKTVHSDWPCLPAGIHTASDCYAETIGCTNVLCQQHYIRQTVVGTGGDVGCFECPSDLVSPGGEATSCAARDDCAANQYVEGRQCLDCPENQASTGGGVTACTQLDCPLNHKIVDHECVPCDPGKYSAGGAGTFDCEACAAGTFVVEGGCESCRLDAYSAASAPACTPCPTHYVTEQLGSTQCTCERYGERIAVPDTPCNANNCLLTRPGAAFVTTDGNPPDDDTCPSSSTDHHAVLCTAMAAAAGPNQYIAPSAFVSACNYTRVYASIPQAEDVPTPLPSCTPCPSNQNTARRCPGGGTVDTVTCYTASKHDTRKHIVGCNAETFPSTSDHPVQNLQLLGGGDVIIFNAQTDRVAKVRYGDRLAFHHFDMATHTASHTDTYHETSYMSGAWDFTDGRIFFAVRGDGSIDKYVRYDDPSKDTTILGWSKPDPMENIRNLTTPTSPPEEWHAAHQCEPVPWSETARSNAYIPVVLYCAFLAPGSDGIKETLVAVHENGRRRPVELRYTTALDAISSYTVEQAQVSLRYLYETNQLLVYVEPRRFLFKVDLLPTYELLNTTQLPEAAPPPGIDDLHDKAFLDLSRAAVHPDDGTVYMYARLFALTATEPTATPENGGGYLQGDNSLQWATPFRLFQGAPPEMPTTLVTRHTHIAVANLPTGEDTSDWPNQHTFRQPALHIAPNGAFYVHDRIANRLFTSQPCQPCKSCNPDFEYELNACAANAMDRTCAACTPCPSSPFSYITGTCSADEASQCAPCTGTGCGSGRYITDPAVCSGATKSPQHFEPQDPAASDQCEACTPCGELFRRTGCDGTGHANEPQCVDCRDPPLTGSACPVGSYINRLLGDPTGVSYVCTANSDRQFDPSADCSPCTACTPDPADGVPRVRSGANGTAPVCDGNTFSDVQSDPEDGGCVRCEACALDEYRTGGCTDGTSQTPTCAPCTECPASTFRPSPCDGLGTSQNCAPCTHCPVGTYRYNDCTNHDTVHGNHDCRACTEQCSLGSYLPANHVPCAHPVTTDVQAGQCVPCNACPPGHYSTGPRPDADPSDPDCLTCVPCDACPTGQRMDQCTASGEDGRTCVACATTTCPTDQYIVPCSGTSTEDDSACLPCKTCGPGQYIEEATRCNGTGCVLYPPM